MVTTVYYPMHPTFWRGGVVWYSMVEYGMVALPPPCPPTTLLSLPSHLLVAVVLDPRSMRVRDEYPGDTASRLLGFLNPITSKLNLSFLTRTYSLGHAILKETYGGKALPHHYASR